MLTQIINGLLNACVGVYNYFVDVITACDNAWRVIYSMLIVMLVARFIIYPFLKGRVINGVGEEIHFSSRNYPQIHTNYNTPRLKG